MTVEKHTFPTYNQPDIEFVRGSGVRLYDANDIAYLDLTGGIAVNSLGHAHPHLVAALKEQADKLWHTSNHFPDQRSGTSGHQAV